MDLQHYNEPLWVSDKRCDVIQNTSEEGTLNRLVKKTAQGKQCVANSSGTRQTCSGEEESVMVWGTIKEEEPSPPRTRALEHQCLPGSPQHPQCLGSVGRPSIFVA